MVYVGIDFSLNSPGVCIQSNNGEYTFMSFFNFGDRELDAKKIPKVYETHRDLALNKTILAVPYNRQVGSKDFMEREREKLIDGKNIAELIIAYIIAMCGDDDTLIAIEGFSYGSTGNSFIDIVQYNTFLRSLLLNEFGADRIYVVQPSHVKKLAGKGNANKHFMAKAFQEDVLKDSQLRKTKLWCWCKEKDFSEKIPLPISDLIDSYFVLKTLM